MQMLSSMTNRFTKVLGVTAFTLTTLAINAAQADGNSNNSPSSAHQKQRHNPQNDLIPILRVVTVPRFWDDDGAFFLLAEVGRKEARGNFALGVPLAPCHLFKIGGDFLFEQLSYKLPCKTTDRWVMQSAAGAQYRAELNFWGLRSLDLGVEWSYAPTIKVHNYRKNIHTINHPHHHQDHHGPVFQRRVNGSNAYAFSAGFSFYPWYWATFTASAVYDRVEYKRKFLHGKVVEGAGTVVTYEQRLTPIISLALRGEYRVPYSYYGGSLRWVTTLYGADVSLGAFGGHTIGRHGMPNSTVAGIEISFDFGISNFSSTRSIGLCWDSPDLHCERSFSGHDGAYLRWFSSPAVYKPEVMAIAEQRLKPAAVREFHDHRRQFQH